MVNIFKLLELITLEPFEFAENLFYGMTPSKVVRWPVRYSGEI